MEVVVINYTHNVSNIMQVLSLIYLNHKAALCDLNPTQSKRTNKCEEQVGCDVHMQTISHCAYECDVKEGKP